MFMGPVQMPESRDLTLAVESRFLLLRSKNFVFMLLFSPPRGKTFRL